MKWERASEGTRKERGPRREGGSAHRGLNGRICMCMGALQCRKTNKYSPLVIIRSSEVRLLNGYAVFSDGKVKCVELQANEGAGKRKCVCVRARAKGFKHRRKIE